MHVFGMQIAIHVLHASSATGTRCSVMSCIQIYILAIRIERALSLQIIISFHRNGTFTFFAHVPVRPASSTCTHDRFPGRPQSSSKGRFTISQLLSLHLFLWPNLRKI